MFRVLGLVVLGGAFLFVGYKAYSWYESRGPHPVVSQRDVDQRDESKPGDLRPAGNSAVAAFKKLASGTRTIIGSDGQQQQTPQLTSHSGAAYFSPWQNLEQIDYSAIIHSRCNHLDIAAYSFTDVELAKAVVIFARSGRPVRIYRDNKQYEDEQKRKSRVGAMLRISNISIRVKGSDDPNLLMHQKSWSDGCVVRLGSANWSPSGEMEQDNNLVFLTDGPSVVNFEEAFGVMWDRRDNIVVQ